MQLFSDIAFNLTLLVTLSVISGFVNNKWDSSIVKGAIAQGLLFGVVATIGIINSAMITKGFLFDGRSVVLSLSGLFFGPIAAIISTSITVVVRAIVGGPGTFIGCSTAVISAAIGVFFFYRFLSNKKQFTTLFFLYFSFIVHFAMFLFLLTLPKQFKGPLVYQLAILVFTLYPLATILIGKILSDQKTRIKTLDALRNRESLFITLTQSSPVGVFRIDSKGTITFANKRASEILNIPSNKLEGKHISNIVYPLDLKMVEHHLNILLSQQGEFRQEFRVNSDPSTPRWVMCVISEEIDKANTAVGYVGAILDIGESKKLEEELRIFQTIFLSTESGIALVYGENLILSTLNPAFAEIHGYTVEELEGHPFTILFPEDEKNERAKNFEEWDQKRVQIYQTHHVKKNGTPIPVRISITSVKTQEGMPWYKIIEVIDITESYEATQRLQEERMRLQNTLEGTHVGLWEQDMVTGINTYSERWAEMIGYTLDEVNNTDMNLWENMLHPDDKKQVMEKVAQHINRETDLYENEFRVKHKNGHWVWIYSRGKITSWDEKGQPQKIYGIHIDISERKRWEQELEENRFRLKTQNEELHKSNYHIQQINAELINARKKAEESDRLKSAFLANMSHEIRTPMNAIIGFSEILLRDNLPNEKRKFYTSVLNASCGQLLNIINDVLDISKIETGQITIHESSLNLNKLFRNIQGLFLQNAENKGNTLEVDFGLDDKDDTIISDEPKLHQILSNLVSNAIKFTDNGSVKMSYKLDGEYLQFSIEDTGIGIDTNEQNLIFERFRQSEVQWQGHTRGTGLGLPIAKAFTELLGGKIWVNSQLDQGSKFHFTIPYKPVFTQTKNITWDNKTQYNFSNRNILIAEDDDTNTLFLKEALRPTKAKLYVAKNGHEAIEQFKKNPDIDVILMDIKMPGMDGVQATLEIRKLNPTIPIIALTAYAMSGDKEELMKAGFSDYLAKPIIRNELLSSISSILP